MFTAALLIMTKCPPANCGTSTQQNTAQQPKVRTANTYNMGKISKKYNMRKKSDTVTRLGPPV